MTTYLLDTSIVIDALRGKHGRDEFLKRLLQEGHLLACSSIQVTEVYAGLRPQEEAVTEEL
ncbi:MAG: PIN domain-containing protein, partial [Terriglobia bacterium]